MKAKIQGEFGTATIDLPDNARNEPEKLKAYIDNFEQNAHDIKSGKISVPDYDSFSSSTHPPQPMHGMGDLKMAESQAQQSPVSSSPIFPTASAIHPAPASVRRPGRSATPSEATTPRMRRARRRCGGRANT